MAITVQTSSNSTTNTASSTVTLPASVSAGDLVIGLIAGDSGAAAFTWPSPWVELDEQLDNASASIGSIAYLIASGGETSVSVTHTSERTNQIAWRIPAAEWHGTTPPENATVVKGTSINPNSGSLSPSWGSDATIWFSLCFWDDSATPTLSTYPTNYADAQANNVAGSSAARCAGASRTLTAATEDPGQFALSGSESWAAWTLAVRPPAAAGNVTVTPGVASLATSTFAPTVTVSDNKLATPGVVSLTLTSFAPSVSLGIAVVPSTAALVTSSFAPTVSATNNQTATPGTTALSLTAFAPTVTASNHKTVTPSTASLSLATFAPLVTGSDHKLVTPSTLGLSLTAFAPNVVASDHKLVTPATASLSLSTFAPSVGSPIQVTPATLALTLATFTPSVSTTQNQTVTPTTTALSLATFAPSVVIGGNVTVTPGTLSLILSGLVPTITAGSPGPWNVDVSDAPTGSVTGSDQGIGGVVIADGQRGSATSTDTARWRVTVSDE